MQLTLNHIINTKVSACEETQKDVK